MGLRYGALGTLMTRDETAKWLQAFGGGCGTGEPAENRVDATYTHQFGSCEESDQERVDATLLSTKQYGIYEMNGKPTILVLRDKLGNKVGEEKLRAGTKGKARALAKRYGATWRKDR